MCTTSQPNPVLHQSRDEAGAEEPILGANLGKLITCEAQKARKPKTLLLAFCFHHPDLSRRAPLSPSPSANSVGSERRLKRQHFYHSYLLQCPQVYLGDIFMPTLLRGYYFALVYLLLAKLAP